MSDAQELGTAFADRVLIRPRQSPDLVDLVNSVCQLVGRRLPYDDARTIDIGTDAEHLIFVVLDGLGSRMLAEYAPSDSWLNTHMRESIISVFPSTTPVALTSLSTGLPPAIHGINGWWTWLDAIENPVTVFHNEVALNKASLFESMPALTELYDWDPILPLSNRDNLCFLPDNLIRSTYSDHAFFGVERIGFQSFDELPTILPESIKSKTRPTYSYVYTSNPDTLAHRDGLGTTVSDSIAQIDQIMHSLVTQLTAKYLNFKIIVTADHGHLAIDEHLTLEPDSHLMSYLDSPPFGDMRMHYWVCNPGVSSEFIEEFKNEFGDKFYLLRTQEALDMNLFGDSNPKAEILSRFGDFVSIAKGATALRYGGYPGQESFLRMKSHHSGLTVDEMLVPLILCEN